MNRTIVGALALAFLVAGFAPSALAADVNGDGVNDPITFVAAAEDGAFAAGLAQADCTVMGIAELDSVGYYVLKGTHKSAAGEMRYLAEVEATALEGYSNLLRLDLKGLRNVANGTYRVRHPQDPNGDFTTIDLQGGSGRLLVEVIAEDADAAVLFAPSAPVQNLFATGGAIELVNQAGQVVAVFDAGVNWIVENACGVPPAPPEAPEEEDVAEDEAPDAAEAEA